MNDLKQLVGVLFFFFGIFMIKKCVEFSLTSFGTLKYEILSFLPLVKNPVTTGLRFLLLMISAIVSSNTIDVLRFFPGL